MMVKGFVWFHCGENLLRIPSKRYSFYKCINMKCCSLNTYIRWLNLFSSFMAITDGPLWHLYGMCVLWGVLIMVIWKKTALNISCNSSFLAGNFITGMILCKLTDVTAQWSAVVEQWQWPRWQIEFESEMMGKLWVL